MNPSMNPPTNFIQVTPFLHVSDVNRAVAFFSDILGFSVPFRMDGYAYVHRETVGVRILEAETEPAPLERRFTYYIDVRDVDALYAELKPKLDTLPAGDVHGPVDQSYFQREFMVVAPDGGLLVFGQAIDRGDSAPEKA
jgi:catechol 2,3-dioxygenase-like lactoylglutathione lyase family enzyme